MAPPPLNQTATFAASLALAAFVLLLARTSWTSWTRMCAVHARRQRMASAARGGAGVVYGIGALVAEKDAGSAGCGDAELEYVALPTLHTRLAGPVSLPTQAWKPRIMTTM